MVNRGKGYFDTFVPIPNPFTTNIRTKVVDAKDMDQNLLKRFGYGVARQTPDRFKVVMIPKTKGLIHRSKLIGL